MFICDIHTHVLPGIDDGAKDWDMSLKMVQASWNAGVRAIIATPHYLPWKEVNPVERIEPLCCELMERSRQQLGIEMKIYPGQEIFYHNDMLEELQRGKILTLAGSRYILVEFGVDSSAQMIADGLERLRLAGYLPILAHMERYSSLHKKEYLQLLKHRGILLQMNIKAIEGTVFNSRTRWCRQQVTEQMVDLMASDMHNLASRPPMQKETLQWMQKHIGVRQRKRLFGGLPEVTRES